ncbi:MAG: hypothetical protein HY423_13995 [Candidatus Lambdaproteobacteria bacterium]|nr:hypothetical protein [Candidatus Lambdaproteobacteria bacterium]
MLALILAGCGGANDELARTRPSRYSVRNASSDAAIATGIGCDTTEQAALVSARRVAHYNLRSVTGDSSYRVVFRIVRQVPSADRVCVEVEAQAVR